MINARPLGTQGIYVVTTSDRWPSKVGISDDMSQRLASLQTASWLDLDVEKFWFPYTGIKVGDLNLDHRLKPERMNTARLAAQVLERAVHAKLKEFDLHMRGEWFDITADEAVEVVEKVAETNGFRLVSPRDIALANMHGLTRPSDLKAMREMLKVANSALEVLTRGR